MREAIIALGVDKTDLPAVCPPGHVSLVRCGRATVQKSVGLHRMLDSRLVMYENRRSLCELDCRLFRCACYGSLLF